MPALGYKIGLRLTRIGFVRNAIDSHADLSAFKQPPTPRIFFGVFLICFSFTIGAPTVSAMIAFLILLGHPYVAVGGGALLYGFSHLCFIAGMALSGEKYTRILLRYATRIGVEKLLARNSPAQHPPKP